MHSPLQQLLLIILLLFSGLSGAAGIEVIPLQSRSAEEILPMIQPFAGPGDTITGMNDKLILKVAPDRLEAIRKLIRQLDVPPLNLLISVRQGHQARTQRDHSGLSVDAGSGHSRVIIDGRVPRRGGQVQIGDDDDRIRAGIAQRDTDIDSNISQQIRTLSGRPAFIQTGQSVPVPQRQVYRQGRRVFVTDSTQYRDIGSGFYVIPRVNGDQVTLDIAAQHSNPAQMGPGSALTQQLISSVQGRLGEWIELGQVQQLDRAERSDWTSQQQRLSQTQRQMAVRVEIAP